MVYWANIISSTSSGLSWPLAASDTRARAASGRRRGEERGVYIRGEEGGLLVPHTSLHITSHHIKEQRTIVRVCVLEGVYAPKIVGRSLSVRGGYMIE